MYKKIKKKMGRLIEFTKRSIVYHIYMAPFKAAMSYYVIRFPNNDQLLFDMGVIFLGMFIACLILRHQSQRRLIVVASLVLWANKLAFHGGCIDLSEALYLAFSMTVGMLIMESMKLAVKDAHLTIEERQKLKKSGGKHV